VGASLVTVGRLHVDLRSRAVRVGEEDVPVTAREFAVLEELAMRRGQVVSRTEISEHVYGFDSEPNSNAIDVHVAQLRRKLSGAGAEGFIQTRRGMGYILEEAAP
jgi:DNA-binding response OmpR family regulator